MIRTSLAASALLLALCGTASAADNAALKKCMDGANTTADMVNCGRRAYPNATARVCGRKLLSLKLKILLGNDL